MEVEKITVVSNTDNCQPCKQYKPTYDKLSVDEDYSDVEFKYVDLRTVRGNATASQIGVSTIPTTIFSYSDGSEKRLAGVLTEKSLRDKLDTTQ